MQRQARGGFSMMEIMIAAVVLVILASVALAGYRGYLDRTAMIVDETNQKVLAAALKLYAYDNNALPGSLSQLRPEHLERAFALVTEGKRPHTLYAHLREWVWLGIAEAEVLPERYYNNNPNVLICPSDADPSSDGDRSSYDIPEAWKNRPLRDLLDSANADQPLIMEDGTEGGFRHQGNTVRVVTTVGGEQKREKSNSGGGSKGGKSSVKQHGHPVSAN